MRCAAPFLLLLAAAVPALADDARPPLTAYEAGPLADADIVIVGSTLSMDSHRRQVFAKLRVERVLRGDVDPGPLLVQVVGPHPAARLADESGGFPDVGLGRHVYFLGAPEEGLAARFRDAFPAEPPVGDVKIEALAREIELSEIVEEERRRRETRAFLIDGLTSESVWMRNHTARDLRRFAAACPSLIRAEDEALLRKLLRSRLPKAQRLELKKLMLWLDERRPGGARPLRQGDIAEWQAAFEDADEAAREAQVRALFSGVGGDRAMALAWWVFDEGRPADRALVVRLVGDHRLSRYRDRVRDAYAGERDADVRAEIVRAMGQLGTRDDTDWLVERSANPLLQRTAWLALARLRTDEALAALAHAQEALEKSEVARDRRTAAWLGYLRSERFPAADRDG